MENTPVFLIGTGRSGTTLVQRLLNSYPDTMIWGEHAGYLDSVAKAYTILAKHPSMEEYSFSQNRELKGDLSAAVFKQPERWQAWNNWFAKTDVAEFFRIHLEEVFNAEKIGKHAYWGFKEIRYGIDDQVLEFLRELYPSAKFIFIVRNGLNTIESQLNTFHQGESKFLTIKRLIQLPIAIKIAKKWAKQNSNLFAFAKKNPDCTRLLRYEDLISQSTALEQLLEFLGKPLTETQRAIMEMSAGRGSSYQSGLAENQRWQRLGPIPIFFLRRILRDTHEIFDYD